MRGAIVAVLASTLVVFATPSQAATTIHTHLDWTEGSFEAGMAGAGKSVFPELVEAPDHERIPVHVNPCHRQLSLGLEYEPKNASARVAHNGTAAEVIMPYRFRATLLAENGTELYQRVLEEPDLSVFFGVVDEPGEYELELELLEGALVDWRVRMRGWKLPGEPSCDLWLNEVELDPGGPDPGNEWIEIFNEGEQAFDVSGWRVGSSHHRPAYTIPDDTVVPAGGHERVELARGVHLADENETVHLAGTTGGGLDASPRVDDTADDDRTWQREDDGLGDWIYAPATPGGPNVEAS